MPSLPPLSSLRAALRAALLAGVGLLVPACELGATEDDALLEPAAAGTGLTGEYFADTALGARKATRLDPRIDFDWADGSPFATLPVDAFSVRWSGQVQAPATGTFTFTTRSDDGVRLRVDGRLLIDAWTKHGVRDDVGTIALTAGQRYDLVMEYFEDGGKAVARLSYTPPGATSRVIPTSQLFPAGADGGGGGGGACGPGLGLPDEVADDRFPETDGATAATTADTEKNRRVRAFARAGGRLIVGGTFTKLGGQTRNRIGAADATTGALIAGFNPNANGDVMALAASPDGAFVYVGGDFSSIAGVAQGKLARLSVATGALDPGFRPSVGGGVNAIAVKGGTVYVGGSFTSAGGQTRRHLAAFSATTGAVTGWNPAADGNIRGIEVSPDGATVYVGGLFKNVGGAGRVHLAALSASGSGAATGWSPTWPEGTPQPVYDTTLSPAGDRLYAAVGGSGASGGNRIRAFKPIVGGNAELWHASADGDHNAVAATAQYVFAGGHYDFWSPGKITRKKAYVVRASDGALVDWDGGFNSVTGVYAILVDCDALYVGGSQSSPTQGLSRFALP